MRLAVVGATGPTGQLVVEQAVEEYGWEVVALVRRPGRLVIQNDKVKVSDIRDFIKQNM